MSIRLIGRKIGMTQIFEEDGSRVPVTVVQIQGNVVLATRGAEKHGYSAVQVAFEKADKQEKDGEVRYRGMTRAQVGVFAKAGLEPHRFVREFRVDSDEALEGFEPGKALGVEVFPAGSWVDVTGTSRGRGFSGVMKRHNFAGFKASHGVHESFRGGGSIGMSGDPARVFKGMKMAGQYGNKRCTVQNLKVVRVDEEDGVLLIKGAVPGARNGIVEIQAAVKKARMASFGLA